MHDIIIYDRGKEYNLSIRKENGKIIIKGNEIKRDGFFPLPKDILKYFNNFLLGENRIKYKKTNEYDIYYDLDTNIKHYFKDNKEDFELLFKNNGMDATLYFDNEKALSGLMKFVLGAYCVIMIASSLKTISEYLESKNNKNEFDQEVVVIDGVTYSNDPLTYEEIRDLIYSSKSLSEEEKAYFSNEKYFTDMLPYIQNGRLNTELRIRLKDFHITTYDEEEKPYALGYYDYTNSIHVLDYDKENFNSYADILAHEFIHVTQQTYGEDMIIESTAEILSNEYYDYTSINSYHEAVLVTKLLMEIIGPKPILEYITTQDINALDEYLKPYLEEKDIINFNKYVKSFEPINREKRDEAINNMKSMLSIVYEKKYGVELDNIWYEQELLNTTSDNSTYHRYYFNTDYIYDQEQNYRIINKETETTVEEAYDRGLISLRVAKPTALNYEEYNERLDREENITIPIINIASSIILKDPENCFLEEIIYTNEQNLVRNDIRDMEITLNIYGEEITTSIDDAYNKGYIDLNLALNDYEEVDLETYKVRKENGEKCWITSSHEVNISPDIEVIPFIENDEYVVLINEKIYENLQPLEGIEYTNEKSRTR